MILNWTFKKKIIKKRVGLLSEKLRLYKSTLSTKKLRNRFFMIIVIVLNLSDNIYTECTVQIAV